MLGLLCKLPPSYPVSSACVLSHYSHSSQCPRYLLQSQHWFWIGKHPLWIHARLYHTTSWFNPPGPLYLLPLDALVLQEPLVLVVVLLPVRTTYSYNVGVSCNDSAVNSPSSSVSAAVSTASVSATPAISSLVLSSTSPSTSLTDVDLECKCFGNWMCLQKLVGWYKSRRLWHSIWMHFFVCSTRDN